MVKRMSRSVRAGLPVHAHIHSAASPDKDSGERSIIIPDGFVQRIGEAQRPITIVGGTDEDQLIRLLHWKSSHAQCVNETKDRRVRSNTERQGHNNHGSEPRGFAQGAQTKEQILYEVLNPIYAARVAVFLFGLLD